MALADVRPFFRTRMNGLGFIEHEDAFDPNNVPQSVLDNRYQIESGPVSSTITGQNVNELDFSITLRVYQKGGRDNVELVDDSWATADTILADIMQPSVRLGTDIKDIRLETISIEPLSGSDDNDLVILLGFNGVLVCAF